MTQELKEKLEMEIINAENDDILLSGKLQNKKEMAEMFEDLTDPQRIEERKLKNRRSDFIKNKTKMVGLL